MSINNFNKEIDYIKKQVIEKLLKAYLIFNGEGIVSGHSLIYLCKMSEKHDNDFKM